MKLHPYPIVIIDANFVRVRHSPRDGQPKVVATFTLLGMKFSGWWLPASWPEPSIGGYWSNRKR